MRAGLLRDSVTVERLGAESTDAYGNPTPAAWATQIAAQGASIMPMGGDEAIRADRAPTFAYIVESEHRQAA